MVDYKSLLGFGKIKMMDLIWRTKIVYGAIYDPLRRLNNYYWVIISFKLIFLEVGISSFSQA